MSEPTYSDTTETAYARLPNIYRVQDEQYDYALKGYLSAIGDQMGDIEKLLNRFEVILPSDPGTSKPKSDLADPAAADSAWLSWLGQVLGVKLAPDLTDAQRRTLLVDPSSSYEVGTKQSIISAAKVYLDGTQSVTFTKTDIWHIGITILSSELVGLTYGELSGEYPTYTDLTAAYATYADFGSTYEKVQAAVEAVKPAGVVLTVTKQ